jgi:hypothetical protein
MGLAVAAPAAHACAFATHDFGALVGFDADGGWWTVGGSVERSSDGDKVTAHDLKLQRWGVGGERESRRVPVSALPQRVLYEADPEVPDDTALLDLPSDSDLLLIAREMLADQGLAPEVPAPLAAEVARTSADCVARRFGLAGAWSSPDEVDDPNGAPFAAWLDSAAVAPSGMIAATITLGLIFPHGQTWTGLVFLIAPVEQDRWPRWPACADIAPAPESAGAPDPEGLGAPVAGWVRPLEDLTIRVAPDRTSAAVSTLPNDRRCIRALTFDGVFSPDEDTPWTLLSGLGWVQSNSLAGDTVLCAGQLGTGAHPTHRSTKVAPD